MDHRNGMLLALACAALLTCGAAAQVAENQPEIVAGGSVEPEPTITFNFKNAPLDQVLDFFSRESGVPIISEAPIPQATLTFLSTESYTLERALTILNLNLHMHKLHLRRDGDFFYLSNITDAIRKTTRAFEGKVPATVPMDTIVTVTIPLQRTNASDMAEKIRGMVAEYGAVMPIEGQNVLVVVETAAQIEKIQSIIAAVDDMKRVDEEYRVFKLVNAKPADVVQALTGLVGERVKQIIIDQNGKQRVVEELSVPGVNLQPDERTNSVVAVGPTPRLDTISELVALLDAPGGVGGASELRTFRLSTITAEEAAATLNDLFKGVKAEARPTILPLPNVGRVAVVGTAAHLVQAAALLDVADPGLASEGPDGRVERLTRVITLAHVTPAEVDRIAPQMLTPRQQQQVRWVATPDERSVIVIGPPADVEAFAEHLTAYDVPSARQRDVRIVKIPTGDPAEVIARVEALFTQTGDADRDPVAATLDSESRMATLIGSSKAVARFEDLLQTVQQTVQVERSSRTYEIATGKPSVIAPKLARLARPMLAPTDGSAYVEPVIEPLDELGVLIVRAEPGHFAVLDELVRHLDSPEPGARRFQIMDVQRGDPRELLDRAMGLYSEATEGMDETQAGPIDAEVDDATGKVVLRGTAGGLRIFADILGQAQQLVPPDRTTRIIDVEFVDAAEIIEPLREFLAGADPIDRSRMVPEPTITVNERTNSLVVTAEDAQHAMISDYVKRLDVIDRTVLPPLKLLQLRAADANEIAQMLTRQYQNRAQADRVARPVEIRSDSATNTLIVSAHEELFPDIKAFVDELNADLDEGPPRETVLFPLKVAKAVEVASAMDKLYPQPPVPVDSRNRPMPWLQKPKEVTVSADASSNSLIIDAPSDRIESITKLAETLDRVELPPAAQVRTYRIEHGDLDTITRTLRSLVDKRVITTRPQPGQQAIQVQIESEPASKTLIVAGDDSTFAQVEEMLEKLGEAQVERGLRIIPIVNADPADVRDRAMRIYEAQIAELIGARPVEVSVNEESNTLEVVGDAEGTQRFVTIIGELQRQLGPAREVRMIELKFAKVGEVIGFLEDLVAASESLSIQGGPDPVFEPIEATNSILVAAQPIQFAVIEQLVRSLDNERTAQRPPLRILSLRTTDAAGLASVLQRNYDARSVEDKAKFPVDVQADEATNSLIVAAHESVLPEIEAIVADLNEKTAFGAGGREIMIFPLQVARAEDLARTIDEMFPEPPMPVDSRGRPMPHLRQPKEIFVRADPFTNSLIVDAPAQRLAAFENIVRTLDTQPTTTEREIRTYAISRADVNVVARALQDLAAKGAFGQRGQMPISITPEPINRKVIVSGPSEIFEHVDRVLAEMNAAPEVPATSVKVYPLKHARADRLQPLLERLLTTRLKEQELKEGFAADVQSLLDVASDPATNSLIITAPQALQQVAEQLITTLDTERSAAGMTTIRIIPLTYTDALQISPQLSQAIGAMDLLGPVGVTPIAGANALMLTGGERDVARVESEVIAKVDVRPVDAEAMGVETFELKHADAKGIADTVQRLLVEQQQTDPRILQLMARYDRNALAILSQPTIRVEADTRTNSLIVSAPEATIELARHMIERLDQPADHSDVTAATFTPARGEAGVLAATIARLVNATVPQGRKPLELIAEPATGSVLAVGTPEQVGEALRLLAEHDERTITPPAADLIVARLEHADAAITATSLQALLNDRTRWPAELRKAERAGVNIPTPTVRADAERNQLVISVPSTLAAIARELIGTFDEASNGVTGEVRVFRLAKGNAASVAEAIDKALKASAQPGEPAPSVTAEPSSNSIVVSASPAQIAAAATMIEEMDDAVEPAGMGVRTIFLKNARAEAVAPVVSSVLERESILSYLRPWEIGDFVRRTGPDALGQNVRVSAERRLNAVVVSAPTPLLELAEQIIADLDSDQSLRGVPERSIRVITLVNADASELARNVEDVFTADDSPTDPPPLIRVDTASNSLIVRATVSQMATIEDLASKLDEATLTTSRQLRMIPINRSKADAAMIAETLRRLIEQQGGATVEVISSEELLKRSEEPRKSGDAGGQRSPRPARWDLIRERIALAAIAQPEQPPAPQPEPTVTIAVDPVTNALFVVGSPRLTERVAALAAELEAQMPAEPTKVRVVTLPETADADAIANVLNQTRSRIGQAGPQNPGGFTGTVAIASDPAGGALIVWANDTDFQTLGTLIGAISNIQSTSALTVKIYPLTNVTSRRAYDAVQDMLSARPVGAQSRRAREMAITLIGSDGQPLEGQLDPAKVRVSQDASGTSLIVSAPADTIPLIDNLISMIDQSPVQDRLAIRRYALRFANAEDLARDFERLFEAQRQGERRNEMPQARFVADIRTNSMLVTASEPQHADVARLLETADAEAVDDGTALAMIPLQHVSPSVAERIVREVFIGNNPGREERTLISGQDDSTILVVRAEPDDLAAIREIVAELDREGSTQWPARTLKLQRADAREAADAINRFFTDRARASATGRRNESRVAVSGHRESGTLFVSASDADFAVIRDIVESIDQTQQGAQLQYRIVPLKNVQVSDIAGTVQELSWDLQWNSRTGRNQQVFVRGIDRTNSIVIAADGAMLDTLIGLVEALDTQQEGAVRTVRVVPIKTGSMETIRRVLEQVTGVSANRRSSWGMIWGPWGPIGAGASGGQLQVEVDEASRSVILIGQAQQIDEAVSFIEELAGLAPDSSVETIALRHADAQEAARTLQGVMRSRTQAGVSGPATVVGSESGNVLIVSGSPADVGMIRDLVAQMDVPVVGESARVEIIYLRNRDATEVAENIRSLYPRGNRREDQVIVVPQPSRNLLIIRAPADAFADLSPLIEELDRIGEDEATRLVTLPLTNARAGEVADALRRTIGDALRITITPMERSNSLVIAGSDEAVKLVMDQVQTLDVARDTPPVEYRRVVLKNARAFDVYTVLNSMIRGRSRPVGDTAPSVDYVPSDNSISFTAPPDEVEWILSMIEQLDVSADEGWVTDWVSLNYAPAEQVSKALSFFYGPTAVGASPQARNVRIVADTITNSLLINAGPEAWENIRSLLQRLDTEQYDSEQQLRVIRLEHADAAEVARALNEGLRAPLEAKLRQEQIRIREQERNRGRNQPDDFFDFAPTDLFQDEDIPTVSSEPRTNSLVIFATPKLLDRIEKIVAQLDQPGFDASAPRLIPIENGKASQIALAIREVYIKQQPAGRQIIVHGDDASNTIIVRAPESQFAEIKALAQSLEARSDVLTDVRVLTLRNIPAARLRQTIENVFRAKAELKGETLAVEVDRTRNALVIASSEALFREIEQVARELDGAVPDGAAGDGVGQGVIIIDVQHNSPEQVRQMLESLGVTRQQRPEDPGIVAEPVTIVPMTSRRAIAVVASAADARTIEALVRSLDAEPLSPETHLAFIKLRLNTATTLARTLNTMLHPQPGDAQIAVAQALNEQIRRIVVDSGSLDDGDVVLDLAVPIRLIPDDSTNILAIASTPANVRGLTMIAKALDTLPIGDAVVVRLFPLTNASAQRIKGVVEELFSKGDALRRLPGTERRGGPPTVTGQALAGEIAVAIDSRTNTLIAAGREEALALVEVLISQLDGDAAASWVEPAIVPLQHADAVRLAQTLNTVLVETTRSTTDDMGLRSQFARLRMLRKGVDPTDPNARIEADLFAPLTGLVITPEEQLNALIVVGTPTNIAVIEELARSLDVEAAAASNTVRIYPLKAAAADRVEAIVRDIFNQRQQQGVGRPEDNVVVRADVRTNSLIVSTSPASFDILDSLITKLDDEKDRLTVGMHVIAVPQLDVTQLAPKIDRMMQELIAARTVSGSVKTASDVFTIEAEPTSNLLIVQASDENFRVVQDLIAKIETGKGGVELIGLPEVIPIKGGFVADVAQKVNDLYVTRENTTRGEGSVTVIPDERNSALLVRGTEQDVAAIRELVANLDAAVITPIRQMKRIELRTSNAFEVAELIRTLFSSTPRAGQVAAKRLERIQYIRDRVKEELEQPGVTEAEIDAAIREQIQITPDLRSNAVTVTAPAEVMKLIEDIIRDQEDSRNTERTIVHFQLKNASARAMAQVLSGIFNLQQGSGGSLILVPASRQPVEGDQPDETLSDIRLVPVADSRQELAITVDVRTNSLIVSGTAEYVEQVRGVVETLDQIRADERHRLVYRLKHAQAAEVEASLRDYFTSESEAVVGSAPTDSLGSFESMLEHEVTVVGEEKSNTILVAASPRRIEVVEQIIRELDSAPPQVMIQVLLAEVTLDAETSWGVDMTLRNLGGDNFGFTTLAAGAGVASAVGVPHLALSSTDLDVMIRSLEAQGKLQVLSRPQVTVANKEAAEINVGQNLAIVVGFETLQDGRTRALLERRDVGLKVNVEPTINSDGVVRMIVRPEISAVSGRRTQISEDVSSDVIDQRYVDTVVTVRDSQTAILGGLIQTRQEDRGTKVPFLGDIPVFGSLFRSSKIADVKTELLVLLTPRVIPGEPSDAVRVFDELTGREIDRMTESERIREELKQSPAPAPPGPMADVPDGGSDQP